MDVNTGPPFMSESFKRKRQNDFSWLTTMPFHHTTLQPQRPGPNDDDDDDADYIGTKLPQSEENSHDPSYHTHSHPDHPHHHLGRFPL
jgi:hypothetical protein